MKNNRAFKTGNLVFAMILAYTAVFAQEPYRRGTTAANFLEIGFGGRGNSMGDAVVSTVNDVSALYWNPAGLALMRQNEVQFMMQPWLADIQTSFAAAAVVIPNIGTLSIGMVMADYGNEEVTTLDYQEGTGEHYSASDYAISLGYGRKLAQWFSFGAAVKLVNSKIWHTTASAFAIDLGTIVNTAFFSPTGDQHDGLSIGMSISNYGTKMTYDGLDLLQLIDPDPYTYGEYGAVEGQYRAQGWELPLIFRIGVAVHPVVTEQQRLTLEINALHPNNNSESINVGAEYALISHAYGSIYFRGGYKALFLDHSEYGPSYGLGFVYRLHNLNDLAVKMDYSFRDVGILGAVHAYGLSILF